MSEKDPFAFLSEPPSRNERPENWKETLARVSKNHELKDPRLLFALGEQENGLGGIEFGFETFAGKDGLLTTTPEFRGYAKQANEAAKQIKLAEQLYEELGHQSMQGGKYNQAFINYFSQGGPGYEGYRPLDPAVDEFGTHKNHAKGLMNFYRDMITDPQTQEEILLLAKRPRPSETREELRDPDVDYIETRKQADELGEIKKVLGPTEAKRVESNYLMDAAALAKEGLKLTQPLAVYALMDGANEALDLLDRGSALTRGLLKGQPGTPLTAQEFTGLEPEPLGPELSAALAGGSLATIFQYPNRAANFAAENIDPIAGAAGAFGTIKVLKRFKDMFARKPAAGKKDVKPTIAGEPKASTPDGDSLEAMRGAFDRGNKHVAGLEKERELLSKQIGETEKTNADLAKQMNSTQESAAKEGFAKQRGEHSKTIDASRKRMEELNAEIKQSKGVIATLKNAIKTQEGRKTMMEPTPGMQTGVFALDAMLKRGQTAMAKARRKIGELTEEANVLLDTEAVNFQQIAKGELGHYRPAKPKATSEIQDIEKKLGKATDPEKRAKLEVKLAEAQRKANLLNQVSTASIAQAVEVVRIAHANMLMKMIERRNLYGALGASDWDLIELFRRNEILNRQHNIRAIPAGQVVMIQRAGSKINLQVVEQLFDNLQPGSPLLEWKRGLLMAKHEAERRHYLKHNSTFWQKVEGGIVYVGLNALIAKVGLPFWNFGAMSAFGVVKAFERWKMAGYPDSNVAPGEAGIMMREWVMAYWQWFHGAQVMKERWQKNINQVWRMGQEPDPADLDRLAELRHLLSNPNASEADLQALSSEYRALEYLISPQSGGKMGIKKGLSAEIVGLTSDSTAGTIVDVVGHGLHSPSYAVGISDAVFRTGYEQAIARAKAWTVAYRNVHSQMLKEHRITIDTGKTGLKFKKAKGSDLTKKDFKKMVEDETARLMEHPDTNKAYDINGVLKPFNELAELEGRMLAMQQPLKGLPGTIDAATRQSALFRMFISFFRVMGITAREGLMRTPVFRRLNKEVRQNINAGGERGAQAKAQLQTGIGFAALAAYISAEELCVGGGPLGREEQESWGARGNEPYTCKVPSGFDSNGTPIWTHLPYDKLAPIGNVLGAMMDMGYLLARIGDAVPNQKKGETYWDAQRQEIANNMISLSVHMVTNNILNSDFRDFFAAFATEDDTEARLQELFARKAPGWSPLSGFARDFNKVIDGELKAADGFWERMQRVWPYMTGGLRGYRNKYGERGEVPIEGAYNSAAVFGGIKITPFEPGGTWDTIETELGWSRVNWRGPDQEISNVPLTSAEYSEYNQLFGKGRYVRDSGEFIDFERDDITRKWHGEDIVTLASVMYNDAIFEKNGELKQSWELAERGPEGARNDIIKKAVRKIKQLAADEMRNRYPHLKLAQLDLLEHKHTGRKETVAEDIEEQRKDVIQDDLERRSERSGAVQIR